MKLLPVWIELGRIRKVLLVSLYGIHWYSDGGSFWDYEASISQSIVFVCNSLDPNQNKQLDGKTFAVREKVGSCSLFRTENQDCDVSFIT